MKYPGLGRLRAFAKQRCGIRELVELTAQVEAEYRRFRLCNKHLSDGLRSYGGHLKRLQDERDRWKRLVDQYEADRKALQKRIAHLDGLLESVRRKHGFDR